ncbi:MAG: nitrous oxide reductase accessory protein NosL [Candidatus Cohnella colombiensis]|uniref:Nitrous oxide reductase accessory protein NosL n=1 Tax=Candidatus Cohnella colombiensis TaxID=3121368 RepID=A0AA95JD42_9BACL|nr:MAG: nitrous oxide reductase accessory protein NosL [Cohnella sp.]
MKKWTVALMIILVVSALTACGATKYSALPIDESVDVCAKCKMLIKDDAFATQLTTKDGKTYKFDDLGCMNSWKHANSSEEIGMDFVRDYNSLEWIEYSKASYVYDASFRTPMAYGIVSFKDKQSAEAYINEQGKGTLMSATDLTSHTWKQNVEGMDMDKMKDHSHSEAEHA